MNLPVGMKSVNFEDCKGLTGDITQMNLPVGMQEVDFNGCWDLTGDLAQLHLPMGVKDLNLSHTKVTGAVDKIVLPEGMLKVDFSWTGLTGALVTMPLSMKELVITGSSVKIDVAAIEWPANATALVCGLHDVVCRTTDPDESKEGAETSEVRIKCDTNQVIGTSAVVARTNDHIMTIH